MMDIKTLARRDLYKNVAIIMGTRPGIIKMAPIVKKLTQRVIDNFVIHTGQHYSENMDLKFFDELELPAPYYRVDNTKECTTHAEQTAEMLRGVEGVLLETKPRIVLVCGDANTNLAAGLAARKLGITVGHVEAGLRSHDWMMPEEHNRIILDHVCELLFAPTDDACQNLVLDNVRGEIYLTGNTIVDSTLQNLDIARLNSKILQKLNVEKQKYILLTCHREENVDIMERLINILEGVKKTSTISGFSAIFPAHPRTLKRLREFGLIEEVLNSRQIQLVDPVGYLDFLILVKNAAIVLTDSGGVQEETCILKTPCVTLRDNTERPETISVGSNCLAGTDPDAICNASEKMLEVERKWDIPFGDGFASARIADVVQSVLKNGVELADVSKVSRYQMNDSFIMQEVIAK